MQPDPEVLELEFEAEVLYLPASGAKVGRRCGGAGNCEEAVLTIGTQGCDLFLTS